MITAIWITGRSGAGKTTLAHKLSKQIESVVIDGDEIRKKFNDDDFTPAGSRNQIERLVQIGLNHEKIGIVPIIVCVSREKSFRKIMQGKFKNCLEIQLGGGTTWEGLDYEE